MRRGWSGGWFVGTVLHVYVPGVYGVSQCWLCVFTGNEEYPRVPFSAWLRLQKGGELSKSGKTIPREQQTAKSNTATRKPWPLSNGNN